MEISRRLEVHNPAVIYHTIEHEEWLAPFRPEPRRDREVLEIGGTQIKMPALVTLRRLKPHGGGLAREGLRIIAPLLEVAIDRRLGKEVGRHAHETLGRVDTIGFQEPNRFGCGQT